MNITLFSLHVLLFHPNELLSFSEGCGHLKFELYQLNSLLRTQEIVGESLRKLKVSAPQLPCNMILSRSYTSYPLVLSVQVADLQPCGSDLCCICTRYYVFTWSILRMQFNIIQHYSTLLCLGNCGSLFFWQFQLQAINCKLYSVRCRSILRFILLLV